MALAFATKQRFISNLAHFGRLHNVLQTNSYQDFFIHYENFYLELTQFAADPVFPERSGFTMSSVIPRAAWTLQTIMRKLIAWSQQNNTIIFKLAQVPVAPAPVAQAPVAQAPVAGNEPQQHQAIPPAADENEMYFDSDDFISEEEL